ncbi:MAG: hypothetical protein JST17_09295 [Bacteroidetes bacterium]|nr:hypothetical protein [Bacteroidota bacterium]MBS1931165.1 hypothetical protein [Bacteroidota bacterium]
MTSRIKKPSAFGRLSSLLLGKTPALTIAFPRALIVPNEAMNFPWEFVRFLKFSVIQYYKSSKFISLVI